MGEMGEMGWGKNWVGGMVHFENSREWNRNWKRKREAEMCSKMTWALGKTMDVIAEAVVPGRKPAAVIGGVTLGLWAAHCSAIDLGRRRANDKAKKTMDDGTVVLSTVVGAFIGSLTGPGWFVFALVAGWGDRIGRQEAEAEKRRLHGCNQ